MIHQFFFSQLSENPNYDYRPYYGKVADISLHDELIQYVGDSLEWVSSYNPAINMEAQMGLNLYGVTVIKGAGARDLQDILMAWSDIFKKSPEKLRLTGDFSWIEGDYANGQYAKLSMDRNQVVESFRRLARTCQKVAESNDPAFIMHFGL